MQHLKTWLFYLGFATLATHELDAMTQSEWRVLWLLRELPDPLARELFVLLHVPLLALLLWLTFHSQSRIRDGSRLALAGFLVVHVGLHLGSQGHPAYSFFSPLSLGLIHGGGLLGLGYLLATVATARR